jgi:hypothetical protein
VEQELADSTQSNAKIDAAWSVLQQATVPQDLHLDIQMQQTYANDSDRKTFILASMTALFSESLNHLHCSVSS